MGNTKTTDNRSYLFLANKDVDNIIAKSVGNDYHNFRDLWKKVSNHEIILDFPPHLDIELNSTCNYNCPFCTPHLRNVGKNIEYMDMDLFKKIINTGAKHGLKSVTLNWINEPLLRNDIANFVAYAKENGIYDVIFNSNGELLNKQIATELILSGLTKISISLDAFSEKSHKKHRPGGNLKIVIDNINNFLKIRNSMGKRLPLLQVCFLESKINTNELNDFIDYWNGKADLIKIQNLTNPFDEAKGKKINEIFSVGDFKIPENYKCPLPFQRMTVRYNGKVLACCNFRAENLVLGDVNTQDLYDIYNGDVAVNIRESFLNEKCKVGKVCEGCIKNTKLTDIEI